MSARRRKRVLVGALAGTLILGFAAGYSLLLRRLVLPWRTVGTPGVGPETIYGLAGSPDGDLLAGVSDFTDPARPGRLRVWAWESGALVREVSIAARCTGIAFAPGGDLVAAVGDDKLYLVPPRSGEPRVVSCGTPLNKVAFSPRGDLVALAADRGPGQLRALPGGELVHELRDSEGSSTFGLGVVAFSPVGDLVVLGESNGVRAWTAADGVVRGRIGDASRDVHDLAFSPSGRYLATASGSRVDLFAMPERALVGTFELGQEDVAWKIAFSSDERLVAFGGQWGVIRFATVPELRVVAETGRPPQVGDLRSIHGLAFSARGDTVAGARANGFEVWLSPR